MAPQYDLLLKGGTMVDPGGPQSGPLDVAVAGGKIAAVAARIPESAAGQVINVAGKLVTPGLIDIHGHFYRGGFIGGVDADKLCLPHGVTTVVDAGSSGWANFAGLRDFVMAQSRSRILAFLHIGGIGISTLPFVGELWDLSFIDEERTARVVSRNSDRIVGIKVRISHDATGARNALPALQRARAAADKAGTRIMAHVGGSPLPLREILALLHPGYIVTHIFNGHENNMLDWDRKVLPEVRAARERGVVLDVGMATEHMDFQVARAALSQGLLPDTLSTDLFAAPRGVPCYGLLDVMSIFLALGVKLEDAVRMTTCNAAQAIGRGDELGSLKVGAEADVAVLGLAQGSFSYRDWRHQELKAAQRLEAVLTLRQGQLYRPAVAPAS